MWVADYSGRRGGRPGKVGGNWVLERVEAGKGGCAGLDEKIGVGIAKAEFFQSGPADEFFAGWIGDGIKRTGKDGDRLASAHQADDYTVRYYRGLRYSRRLRDSRRRRGDHGGLAIAGAEAPHNQGCEHSRCAPGR